MLRFHHKYRTSSTRLQKWDYGWNGLYFVTIKTKNGEYYFGNVGCGEMFLSAIGEIAWQFWSEIPSHFPFVKLDAFVVMPNHVHGIIIIEKPYVGKNWKSINGCNSIPWDQSNYVCTVETQNFASLQHDTKQIPITTQITDNQSNQPKNKFGPQSENLPSIIRGFKSAVTINARKINAGFAWQPRYYDIIIQDKKSYDNIRNYIIDNPANWD